ncbi:MAG: Ubiquinone/menaquinone biosynthesis C-methyltransferase UbiE [Phycisphaerales bacterium]|nr:Ubiquinone/menaquinone biosynthesis C-methyltransferase UbiE [Phycisphaerales bacterium]
MKREAATPITDLLAALGEQIRLRILRLLEAEELSVGELASVTQLPQSTVSRHLKTLSDGGWLVKRSDGAATLYRMVLDDLPIGHRSLWLTVRDQMGHDADLAEDSRRLRLVLAERMTDSHSFFGRVAGEWDSLRGQLFGDRFTPRALLSLLPRNWVVADIGCGTGNASELLAPCVERVISIDPSEPMLDAARRRLADLKNVQFVNGSMEALPIADQSVDAAVAMLVLHHVADPAAAVQEMARIVRTGRGGGLVLVVDMVSHDREHYRRTMGHRHLGFQARAVTEMFRAAGLRDIEVREIASEPDARGPGLFVATGRINS